MEKDIIPVKDIDWANPKIYRAGIIPVYVDDNNKWIGLGVNKFSANLTVIGGGYEPGDYDLLCTAARELREEVGDNIPHISEESLYSCWAIQSDYSISIILPVDKCCFDFRPTDELHDILWVTPKQLRIMADNQNFVLPKTVRTKAFLFSMDLAYVANRIATAVERDDWYEKKCITKFPRNKRIDTIIVPKINKDINIFTSDSSEFKAWGNTYMTIIGDKIMIMRRDRMIYILSIEHLPIIIKGLNKLRTKTHFALCEDLDNPIIAELVSNVKIGTIESDLKMVNKSTSSFVKNIQQIRKLSTKDRLVQELNLINTYENMLYECVLLNGCFFNEKRALFLKNINRINSMLINKKKISTIKARKKLMRSGCLHRGLDVIIETGLVKYGRNESVISLC